MSEERFERWNDHSCKVKDNQEDTLLSWEDVVHKLNEQQSTIKEYEDFCYNLCMFIISRNLDDEFREKYGKEYKIITKWVGCGIDD